MVTGSQFCVWSGPNLRPIHTTLEKCIGRSRIQLKGKVIQPLNAQAIWNGSPPNILPGLQPTRWQSTWMEGFYCCRVVPTIMWVWTTFKISYSKHVGFFCWVGIACFGRQFHVSLKCRSQSWEPIPFTYNAQFGLLLLLVCVCVCVSFRLRWRLCTTWSYGFGKKQLNVHVACSMRKGKSPKMTSCDPSNFEGNKLHPNLLKKTPNFGSSSFVIHITY